MKAIVTPANSPYQVVFPSDASSLPNEAFNIDVSGSVTIILPSIASLQQTWNQKICVTNIAADSEASIQPSAGDRINANGTGVAVNSPASGVGNCVRLQPSGATVWSAYETGTDPAP